VRVAIFTDETGWHTRQLQRALRRRGAEGRCIDLADCRIETGAAWHGLALPGFGRELPDAAIVRGIAGGSFEQVTKRLGVLHALRELGVAVYNDARAIERSVDKSMTSLLLHAAGVPTPPTWATESAAQAQRLVTREGAADGVHVPLPDLAPFGGLAYLQRFVPPLQSPGFDWRVLVIGGRAAAAMRRVSEHWVHNVKQGARVEPATLEPALAALAERAAAALRMDYAGIDILPSPEGPQVLEVNGVAAWQGLQRVTAFNLAEALVDDLLERKLARPDAQQHA